MRNMMKHFSSDLTDFEVLMARFLAWAFAVLSFALIFVLPGIDAKMGAGYGLILSLVAIALFANPRSDEQVERGLDEDMQP